LDDDLKIKLKTRDLIIILNLVIILFFTILFKSTGLKVIIFLYLCYLVPLYIILDKFKPTKSLAKPEKIIFSIFISIGLFPILTHYIGRITNSLKTASIITFIILMIAAAVLWKQSKK